MNLRHVDRLLQPRDRNYGIRSGVSCYDRGIGARDSSGTKNGSRDRRYPRCGCSASQGLGSPEGLGYSLILAPEWRPPCRLLFALVAGASSLPQIVLELVQEHSTETAMGG